MWWPGKKTHAEHGTGLHSLISQGKESDPMRSCPLRAAALMKERAPPGGCFAVLFINFTQRLESPSLSGVIISSVQSGTQRFHRPHSPLQSSSRARACAGQRFVSSAGHTAQGSAREGGRRIFPSHASQRAMCPHQ